jgi:hypothetical protein
MYIGSREELSDPIINDKGVQLSPTLLAYMAGFFDGEGCITAGRTCNGGRRYLIVCTITQKTCEVLDLVRSYFGGSITMPTDYFRCYRLRLTTLGSYQFLRAVSNLLIVKYQQAQVAMEFYETRQRVNIGRNQFRGFTEEEKEQELVPIKLLKALKKEPLLKPYLTMPQKDDVRRAYIAGMFDGDGSINISRARRGKGDYNHFQLSCCIGQCAKALVAYVQSIYGGAIFVMKRKSTNHSTCYLWRVSSQKAFNILWEIYDYLIIKKSQADLAFEFQNGICSSSNSISQEQIGLRQSQKMLMHELKHVAVVTGVGKN